jgi:anti-sigma factor RsiW
VSVGRGRKHDPERDAARYIAGEGRSRWRERFESHLVSCEACWTEVQMGRRGRMLAERARELTPPELRDQVRAAVEMSDRPRSWSRRLPPRVVATALGAMVVVGGLAVVATLQDGSKQPEAIAAAVASYRSHHPSTSGPPAHHPPDMSSAGLGLDGGGRVVLDGLVSDVFTYHAGDRLVYLFLASGPFPEAAGARERSGAVHGWEATSDGVALVCSDSPVSYLLMSDDPVLLSKAEAALRSQPASLDR